MKDGPNIARIAALLGDPARAEALTALMADRALTATELSAIAGVTKQTMSAHLAKLVPVIRRHDILAALSAIQRKQRCINPLSAALVREHASILVVRMSYHHKQAGPGVEFLQALPQRR